MTWCRFSHQYHRRQFWPTLTDMAVHFLPVKKYIQASYKLSGARAEIYFGLVQFKKCWFFFFHKKGCDHAPFDFYIL